MVCADHHLAAAFRRRNTSALRWKNYGRLVFLWRDDDDERLPVSTDNVLNGKYLTTRRHYPFERPNLWPIQTHRRACQTHRGKRPAQVFVLLPDKRGTKRPYEGCYPFGIIHKERCSCMKGIWVVIYRQMGYVVWLDYSTRDLHKPDTSLLLS